MFSSFKDKVVVITGGSDGIGKAMVELFLASGAKVSTCGRNQDKLYQLQTHHIGAALHTRVADVANENDCKVFIQSTFETFGKIDILINNAGISMRSLFKDATADVLKRVMEINFFGVVYCTKFAIDSIIENKGSVVNVSSIAGYRGLPGRTGYSASKFALNGFSEALRTELLESGANVLWVCPGFTASNIRNTALDSKGNLQGESPMDEGEMMSSEECAMYILKAIEKRKRTLVLTFKGKQAVFINKFFPSWADKLVRKFFFRNGDLVK